MTHKSAQSNCALDFIRNDDPSKLVSFGLVRTSYVLPSIHIVARNGVVRITMYQLVVNVPKSDLTPGFDVTYKPYIATDPALVPKGLVDEIRSFYASRPSDTFMLLLYDLPDDRWEGPLISNVTQRNDRPVIVFTDLVGFLDWLK